MNRLRTAVLAGAGASLVAVALLAEPPTAEAQLRPRPPVRRPSPTQPVVVDAGTAVRTRFGIDRALVLIRSPDAEERLRGVERAAALGGPEARILLSQVVANVEPRGDDVATGLGRRDPRALLAATRGLADELLRERPAPMAVGPDGGRSGDPATLALISALLPVVEGVRGAGPLSVLVGEARAVAARALALSTDPRANEALLRVAADGQGEGVLAATEALRQVAPARGVTSWIATRPATPNLLSIVAASGDLRAAPLLRAVLADRRGAVRAATLTALRELLAPGLAELARPLVADPDPAVRVAAVQALIGAGAPDAAPLVARLLADSATAPSATTLAEQIDAPVVAEALARRAASDPDAATRRNALVALASQRAETAPLALAAHFANGAVVADAVSTLARCRSPATERVLADLAGRRETRRLAARALLARALAHGTSRELTLATADALAQTGAVVDRALATEMRVALGALPPSAAFEDAAPEVRIATVLGAYAMRSERTCRALTTQIGRETVPAVRTMLGAAIGCDPRVAISTAELWTRAKDGGPDGPLAWSLLAARATDRDVREVLDTLVAPDPILRAHVARGLVRGAREDVGGRLGQALAYEEDAAARRALVDALAVAGWDSPTAAAALTAVASWDRSPELRQRAARALRGERFNDDESEVAVLRITASDGRLPPSTLAALGSAAAVAWPVAFDADGFAVVPGMPAGPLVLRLAPRVP